MQFSGDTQVDLINGLIRLQTEQSCLLERLRRLKTQESVSDSRPEFEETLGGIAHVLVQQSELLGLLRSERLFEAVLEQQEYEYRTGENSNNEESRLDQGARDIAVGDSVRILDREPWEPIIGIVSLIEEDFIEVISCDNQYVRRRADQLVRENLIPRRQRGSDHE